MVDEGVSRPLPGGQLDGFGLVERAHLPVEAGDIEAAELGGLDVVDQVGESEEKSESADEFLIR